MVENSIKICDCGHPPTPTGGCGTGYGYDDEKKTYCYACCAENDKQYMREHTRICLYATYRPEEGVVVTNWPGSLKIKTTRFRRSKHSAFGKLVPRLDVWFEFEGQHWHGVVRGESNEVCHCRKVKKKVSAGDIEVVVGRRYRMEVPAFVAWDELIKRVMCLRGVRAAVYEPTIRALLVEVDYESGEDEKGLLQTIQREYNALHRHLVGIDRGE